MPRPRILSPFVQELIRWRWESRPTIKSLAAEYGVSHSNISDIINPELRKRRSKKYKEGKKVEQEVVIEAIPVHSYPARKVSRRKG
jgi:hypothetical protein